TKSTRMIARLKEWSRVIKRDVHALYLASRDPRVPWYAKALALCVAGYALSPIDLIPDFIPVLGYLDDVILVPLGIVLVIRLIPPDIMAEHRLLAAAAQDRPVSRTAAIVIALIWAASIALVGWLCYRFFIEQSSN
ncbi:MAG: YkvA family protein, partial [Aestuariivirgaceae bacterium]